MNDRICAVPDCGKCSVRAWLCPTHARRWRLYGTLVPPDMRKKPHPQVACRGGGCTASISALRDGTGLCRRCYRRQWYLDHAEHERVTMAAWHDTNAEHKRSYTRRYYVANRDVIRERAIRAYYEDHEAELARRAAYREANRDRMRAQDAERRRNDPNWPLRNRENAQRRAKAPDGSKVDYAEVLAEHGMVCHICKGDIESLADLHFDHVIPLVLHGPHHPDNIRPAHARCNLQKGARIIA